MCCGSWGHKESDPTEQLNCTELNGPIKASWASAHIGDY